VIVFEWFLHCVKQKFHVCGRLNWVCDGFHGSLYSGELLLFSVSVERHL
jgi:hypothetical protein